jgi:hypothetical protein
MPQDAHPPPTMKKGALRSPLHPLAFTQGEL